MLVCHRPLANYRCTDKPHVAIEGSASRVWQTQKIVFLKARARVEALEALVHKNCTLRTAVAHGAARRAVAGRPTQCIGRRRRGRGAGRRLVGCKNAGLGLGSISRAVRRGRLWIRERRRGAGLEHRSRGWHPIPAQRVGTSESVPCVDIRQDAHGIKWHLNIMPMSGTTLHYFVRGGST